MYFYHKIYHRFAVLFTYLRLSKMTKQLFNAYCMMFLFLKLLRNFQMGSGKYTKKINYL
ncbi:hypothetical protein HMPREF9514_01586 [Enterococcus faecalis TX0855]|nr:predicted protein [Enterococcus faecalis HIP11704]EFM65807.1 hypothetical protein HMPREF9509_02974 [Enterococcus faecalis TX0411]EFM79458.1 hypothetical protein HMPREF9514_01586 [Enterococcus faecalis TX0855]EFT37924.1 hypothetical protein HMPREF9494_02235 [Enterococcus faecalis TX2137]EFT40845.1 hypothetical protein HMPREF9496_02177 [Enterococcus faecalis TX4000]EJU88170.1 hypothetical protein HMPREF1327_01868 [Enterococcus faecalis 599]EPH94322.1 hypothetical protein D921_01563 [Enteroco